MSKPSATTDRKPSGQTAVRPAKPAGTAQNNKPDFKPGNQNKPIDVARPKPGQGSSKPSPKPGMKPGYEHPIKPVQVHPGHSHVRPVPPRERHFMHYSKPAHFWSSHNHCYGYRVKTLPINIHRHVYRGITYFCYNDVWYRPYNGYYIVCRPPFETILAANLIADMAWTAVRLSYINTVVNTYSQINENNAYIAQQNAMIAQNNATIAAQNQQIAMNQERADAAYGLADQLGLVQSYASASTEYFYQDGVFYMKDGGQYKVIVPPAGALVETLPEDFEMITLRDGNEYYRVDDTVYRITISEGKPYFEVLGQM